MRNPVARSLHASPECFVCHRPVEQFTEEDGEGAQRGYVLFVARCHGEVERQKCPRGLTRGLNFSMAFVPLCTLPADNSGSYSNLLTPVGK